MAIKVSNETKIGALTAITITLFILGFNFLKGKSPLKKTEYLYAKFQTIDGLVASNPVFMNGLAIGSVYKTEPGDEELSSVLVTLRITENVKIPANSVAGIKSNPLGTSSVEIIKGDARSFFNGGDTILAKSGPGLIGGIMEKLAPTQESLNKLLMNLDTVSGKVNATMTPAFQADLQATLANLRATSAELTNTVAGINKLVNDKNGALSQTLSNAQSFTGTLADNKDKLNNITGNLETTTSKLAAVNLQATIDQLNSAVAMLKATLEKVNDPKSSVGALINDRRMYDNLSSTLNSTNLLLQDLRMHPKRYVNVSVFGKKDKSEPLMKPMAEDSVTQEQRKN